MINPEEAEVVKRIYREYLEGKSYYAIGQGMTADGIRTAAGSDYWLASTLKKILTNEKYIGDALFQKTVTTDFLNKKPEEIVLMPIPGSGSKEFLFCVKMYCEM